MGRGDQAEAGGGESGRTEPVDNAGGKEHPTVLREAADKAREGKHDDAGLEDGLATEEVAGPGPEHEKTSEGHEISVDDPLLLSRAQVQARPHCGQGHVHDGAVENHHRLRERGDNHDDRQRHIGFHQWARRGCALLD